MTRQEYVEQLNEQRLNVLKACEGLSDEEFLLPMAEGKWSVKDTLGHLAAWEGEVIRAFEQKARGERPTIGDIADFNAWNNGEAAKRTDRSADEIRSELHDGRTRLLTIVNDLPPEGDLWAPERSTAKLLSMLIEHDAHHSQQIHDYRCAGPGKGKEGCE